MPADIWDQAATVGAAPPAAAPAKFVGPVQASAPVPKGDIWDQAAGIEPKTGILDDIGDTLKQYWDKINPVTGAQGIAHAVANPATTFKDYGSQTEELGKKAVDSFKSGDYVSGVRHGLSYFLNAIPGLGSALDEAGNKAEKGDVKGAIADTAALATQLAAAKAIPAVADAAAEPGAVTNAVKNAAETTGAVVKGAASGAKEGLTGMTNVHVKGLPIKVPDVVAGATAGAGVARMVGVPHELGAAVGAVSPVAYRAYQGVREALTDLAQKRAVASQAARDLAAKIKNSAPAPPDAIPPERQLPPAPRVLTPPAPAEAVAPDTTGPIPTDPVSGRPLPVGPAPSPEIAARAAQQPVPVQRQLPPVSPTITAGPITPSETVGSAQEPITYTPPTIPDTSGPVPTDKVTGRPLSAAPPAAAPAEELITKQEIAKGLEGKADQGFIDAIYNQIHGIETPAPAKALPPDQSPLLTGELEYQAPDQPDATPPPAAGSPTPPVPAVAQPETLATAAPAEEPVAPVKPPASRVVNYPGDPSKEFAPSKLMTEEGLAQYAKDNGIPEDQARTALSSEGYQVVGRAQLNRALHAIGSEMGMDHDTLSDVAKITHRVKSMTQLSQEQMLGLYQDLLDKRSISEPLVNKSEMGTEAAGQPTKAPGNSTSGKTAVPAVLQNNPKALAAAQALSDALREQPQ